MAKLNTVIILTLLSTAVGTYCLYGCGKNNTGGDGANGNKNGVKIEHSVSTVTDNRDGKVYRIVKIAEQVWLAENLNYKTPKGSWCYRNDSSNCDKYGRLYDWATARSACPKGWHLSSREEWNELVGLINSVAGGAAGTKLKSTNGWHNDDNGSNNFGFSAMPGGDRSTGGYFNNAGYVGYWWTDTESGRYDAYRRGMYYDYDIVDENSYSKELGFSVRCTKNRNTVILGY